MRMWMNVFVVLAVAVSAVPAEKKQSPLQGRLESEFLGKSFETKIRLGSYVRLASDCFRLIDTEYSTGGTVRYQARRGCYLQTGKLGREPFAPNFYVDSGKITKAVSPGAKVSVGKIDLMDDRVELWLAADLRGHPVDSYAKIKFMVGKGYQGWDYEKLVDVIAQALRVESRERVATLEADFADLKSKLGEAEARHRAAAGPATERLQTASHLRDLLQQMAQNRSAWISAGRADPEAGTYLERASALDAEITKLQAEARSERVEATRARLRANAAEAAKLKAVLEQQPPATLPEWEQRSQSLKDYRRLLDERRPLYAALEKEGEAGLSADLEKWQQELKDTERLKDSLAREQQTIQLARLSAEYRDMARKRAQLLDAYTRGFGSAQERPALQALIAHLEQMRQNRTAAQQLGDSAAATELSRLQAEIDKFRKR